MADRSCAIGVEIGGTALRIGLVDGDGRVIRSVRRPSADLREQLQAAERLVGCLEEFLTALGIGLEGCDGIGIGAAGYVDNESREMILASNLGWRDYALGQAVEDLTQTRVVVDKDTNMAALGELAAGSGRGLGSFIYAALGTGVGGAIIHDRDLLRGRKNSGGDFGHVYAGGHLKCGCGLTGCLETVAGGVWIARRAREAVEQGVSSVLSDRIGRRSGGITAQTVAEAANRGDALARETLADAARAVGTALVNIIRMVGPQAVILGGSLGQVRAVFEDVRRYVEPNSVFPGTNLPQVRVLPAALDDSAAIIGAGLAVLRQGRDAW